MKETEKRRIKLRENYDEKDRIYKDLSKLLDIANERVIPLMRGLDFKISLKNVLRYVGNSDALKSDYVKRDAANSGLDNERLIRIVEKDAGNQFDELLFTSPYAYDDVTVKHSEFLKLENETLITDDDAIREAATVYVEDPAELEAYDRHQKAAEILNAFYNGKAPDSAFEMFNHFPVKDGVVLSGTWINYETYVNHE